VCEGLENVIADTDGRVRGCHVQEGWVFRVPCLGPACMGMSVCVACTPARARTPCPLVQGQGTAWFLVQKGYIWGTNSGALDLSVV